MLQFQFQESMASISDVANSISDVANSILDVAISILDLHQFLQMFLLKKTSDESMSQLKAWKLYQSTLHLCTWWEAIWRCFAQWNPFYIRPCITGRFISITSHLKQAGSRLSGPICFPQGASGHRGLLQNEVVQICRQWPLQVTWWNGWQKQQKVDVGFQWPKANEAGKKVCTDREKGGFFDLLSGFLRISFCYLVLGTCWFSTTHLPSLTVSCPKVCGSLGDVVLVDSSTLIAYAVRAAREWSKPSTQRKQSYYVMGTIRMRWLQSGPLPAISRVTRRVITPQERGPITHLPIC